MVTNVMILLNLHRTKESINDCIKMKHNLIKMPITNWPRRLNMSLCLILFMLVTCFSVSMLVLTQILLSSNTLESNNYSSNGFHLFTKMKSRLSLENLLANFNDSYKIEDSQLSLYMASFEDMIHNQNTDDPTINHHFFASSGSDFWQIIRSSSNKFYIFSAYIDSYNRSNLNNYLELDGKSDQKDYFIRIIAVTSLSTKEKIICGFYFNNSSWFREGKMKPIREHWNLQYSAFFIYCPLPKNLIKMDTNQMKISCDAHLSMIAISALWPSSDVRSLLKQNAQLLKTIVPSNRMPIHSLHLRDTANNNNNNNNNNEKTKSKYRMAVCVKPLHYHYNKTISLIEFIELNRLLGVERFYFYNHTIGFQVDHVLRLYQKLEPSLISILPWWLPIKSQTEIRTEGIFAALNDCLYRAKANGYTYVIFIDLDEFIIPYHHRSLVNLVQDIKHIYPDKVGAYSFRNGFFYLQYPDDQLETIEEEYKELSKHLVTISKTLRKVDLNIHKQRSKCIVLAEHTIEMGNHFVWEFTNGKHTLNIEANIAFLHHYRVCEFGGDGCIYKSDPLLDRRVHFWSRSLLKTIQQRIQWFCDIIYFDACNVIA